jgi:hypothetical protein
MQKTNWPSDRLSHLLCVSFLEPIHSIRLKGPDFRLEGSELYTYRRAATDARRALAKCPKG